MGRLLPLGLTAMAMAAVWVVASANSGNTMVPELKAQAEAVGLRGAIYKVKSPEVRGECLIARGTKVTRGVYNLEIDPSCDALMSGMTRVRQWRERADGSVEFVGEGGDTLAAFGVGDGVDYESFRPRTPLLMLSSGG